MAVRVPAGAQRVELRYTPYLFPQGLGLGLLSIGFLWWWGSREEEWMPPASDEAGASDAES